MLLSQIFFVSFGGYSAQYELFIEMCMFGVQLKSK